MNRTNLYVYTKGNGNKQRKNELINLTLHAIVIQSPDGSRTSIDPDPRGPARVEQMAGEAYTDYCPFCNGSEPVDDGCHLCGGTNEIRMTLYGAELMRSSKYGEVKNLPAQKDRTFYIVSALVANQCPGRWDVFSPGTGPNDNCIRNSRGQIVAITRLVQAPPPVETEEGKCP